MKSMKNVPVGAKIISVLYYIGAILEFLGGLALLFASGSLGTLGDVLGALIGAGAAVGGVIIIAFAVLQFFVARGLWRGDNWARIVAIIFAALGTLSGLLSLVQGRFGAILSLAISLTIGLYLLLNKEVKKVYEKK